MRTICFYFQVHQPFRIRKYRFFDIGTDHYYWDDYSNKSIMRKVAEKCYLPANRMFLDLIKEWGNQFKISYSISGSVLEQMEMYAPDVLHSFKMLAETGCVEFLAETHSHSLVSLKDKNEFTEQVKMHSEKIERLFGQKPKVFRNTELIYSDQIGQDVAEMGFKAMITEGAKHILGWKSPNFLYCNAIDPKLKVLLRNFRLSDDIAFRFSNPTWGEWPLTTDKFISWINVLDPKEEIINLFMDYETFGEHQWAETGIFEFMKSLPAKAFANKISFSTPSDIVKRFDPVSAIHAPYPISWADEERDLTAWLGNELQDEAFISLYAQTENVKKCNDPHIQRDWKYLQTSDHFYYMCTKWFSDGDVHTYFNPYNSPYEAYINYMNALSDFIDRVDRALKTPVEKITKTEPEKLLATTKKTRVASKKVKIIAPKKQAVAKKTEITKIAEKKTKKENSVKTKSSANKIKSVNIKAATPKATPVKLASKAAKSKVNNVKTIAAKPVKKETKSVKSVAKNTKAAPSKIKNTVSKSSATKSKTSSPKASVKTSKSKPVKKK